MITKTITLAEAKEYLTKIPFYLEGFEPVTVDMDTYTKEVSPLFSEDVVEQEEPPTALVAAIEQAPLYHAASTVLGVTRDPASIDVPSSLQSEFWQTLFRDTFGAEGNALITAIYNRLRYVYLSEESILFSSVFKQLLSAENETTAIFSSDVEEANSIIDAKLSSTYSALNYEPLHSSFIDSWLESMHLSGQLTSEAKVTEENLYRIQDVKAELLRRKFAGSSTLYSIVLSSINRRGAYIPVVPLNSVAQQGLFQDNRFIRALDMPGITTIPSSTIIDPMTAFADDIPIKTISAMYYSSFEYNAESFVANRAAYLRNRYQGLSWDNIKGILDPSLVKKTYPKLDQTNPNTQEPYKLDTTWEESGGVLAVVKLDDAQPMFDLSATTAGFFDIQADQVLYINNTVQKARNHEYQFLTYSVAGGAGPCMMDIPWLDYIEKAVSYKKRIQEKLQIGVQVSRLVNMERHLIEENFIAITFSSDISDAFDSHDAHYSEGMKYAYLWNIKIRYDRETFEVASVGREVITYMLLRVDSAELSDEVKARYIKHPSYKTFTAYTTGLIPFTYTTLKSSDILTYKLILDEDTIQDDLWEEDYNKAFFLFTPYEQVAIAKAYLRTDPGALVYTGQWFNAPTNDAALKHVIYGVSRVNEAGTKEYFWSDPVRLYPKAIADIKYYRPDWMEMALYINPYLSYVSASASPVRRQPTAPRAIRPATEGSPTPEPELATQDGPGADTALTNLNKVHGMELYCNDSGATDDANWPRGSYLHKHRPETLTAEAEIIQIWGDNRPLWDSPYTEDPLDDWDNELVRTTIAKDLFGVPCLKMRPGIAYATALQAESWYAIAPDNTETPGADWADWQWNDVLTSGMTFCIDLSVGDAAEDQFFASRYASPVADEVHAEFDIKYTSADRKLVFSVYPTGRVADMVFEVELSAEFILNKQSQLAMSYLVEADAYDTLKTNITMTIVADRSWANKYYSTIDLEDGTYEVYETAEDFDIDGVTPVVVTLPTVQDYTIGYGEVAYRFGSLIKYKGQASNTLADICLLNREHGYNTTLGDVYDIRLYTRGMKLEEAILAASGTRRELYSYSPALYKLSYQQHSDAGVLKRANNTTLLDEVPGRVRIFQRSVWDSIVCDLYPMSAAEKDPLNIRYRPDYKEPLDDPDVYDQEILPAIDYKLGVVDQRLVNNYESLPNATIESGVDIFYRNTKLDIPQEAVYSMVQTTIYPRRYQNNLFTSELKLVRDLSVEDKICFKAYHDGTGYLPAGAHSVEIPSIPSGDTLEYRATFDIDFAMTTDIDAAVPLARGTNVKISYDEELEQFTVGHLSTAINKNAQADFALYPLYIPSQGANEEFAQWRGRISGFEFQGLRLSPSLSKLLDAKSYYSEVQTPYAYEDSTTGTGFQYTSRWTAIRGLKDGEYYITCKYPLKIVPFENHKVAMVDKPVILYNTIRLKVVASSAPSYYEETNMPAYRAAWEPSNIVKTMSTPFSPVDNRYFPHREVKLDLYVLKNTSATEDPVWRWYKLASNHDTGEGVQQLTEPANQLVIPGSITGYLTKNYTAPFFIQGESDVAADMAYVYIANASQKEQLRVAKLSDLDDIVLLSGRSYRLLLDYTANVSEFSYSSTSFVEDPAAFSEPLSSEELDNYNNLTSIKDILALPSSISSVSPFMYDSRLNWGSLLDSYDLDNSRTGYYVEESTGDFKAVNTDLVANDLALGNPYSKAKSLNKLLNDMDSRRFEIYELCYFPYRQEDKDISAIIPPHPLGAPKAGLGAVTGQKTMLVTRNASGAYRLKATAVDEYSIIVKQHSAMKSSIIEAFRSILTSTNGLITSFAKLRPVLTQTTGTEQLKATTHTLVTYKSKAFSTPLALAATVTRQSLYGSNLIATQNFQNYTYYVAQPLSSYVYDAGLGEDVFSYIPRTGTTSSTFRYLKDVGGSSIYRTKVSLYSAVGLRVTLVYYKYSKTAKGAYSHMETTSSVAWTSTPVDIAAGEWTTLTWETPSAIDPAYFDLVIAKTSGAAYAGESVRIRDLDVRKTATFTHKLGLSDAVLGVSGALVTGRANLEVGGSALVAFQYIANDTFFPLQFINKRMGKAFNTGDSFAKTFIGNYNLLSTTSKYSEVVPMMRPWTRMMLFKESDPRHVKFFKYSRRMQPDGSLSQDLTKVVGVGDILTVYNDYPDEQVANRSIVFNQLYNDIEYAGDYGLVVNADSISRICEANIVPVLTDLTPVEERFSLISGCIDPAKFIAGRSSVVGVTNIQVLNNNEEDPAILYELEYLPIIYDESKHHLSLNLLTRSQ